MGIKVTTYYQGGEWCNTYIVGNEGSPCFIIDPGYNKNNCLDRYIDKHHGGVCLGYLLTHGHWDHISGLSNILHEAPVYIHEEELEHLSDPRINGSYYFGYELKVTPTKLITFSDNEIIRLGETSIKVIHTPFHTGGSSIFFIEEENVAFTGDTLFHLSIGRSDLPKGSPRLIEPSLSKLKALNEETKIYPGHGPNSDMKTELRLNPYLTFLKGRI